MTLISCSECGKQVSDEAKTCPECGAKIKKPYKWTWWKIALVIFPFFAIAVSQYQDEQRKAAEAAKSPEQRAAETKQKLARDLRYTMTYSAAKTIKDNLRDPASVQWISIRANENGSVVCFDFRARNGVGGLNREQYAYVKGQVSSINPSNSRLAGIWNKNCAGTPLYDMTATGDMVK